MIIGADGGGSSVRRKIVKQFGDITVTKFHLDDRMVRTFVMDDAKLFDNGWLYILNTSPLVVTARDAGGSAATASVDWYLAPSSFSDANAYKSYLKSLSEPFYSMLTEQEIEVSYKRGTFDVGRGLFCSQYHSNNGKAVLIGDAAHPFPPIGQGVNIAIESAVVLDKHLALKGISGKAPADPEKIRQALVAFDQEQRANGEGMGKLAQMKTVDHVSTALFEFVLGSVLGPSGIELAKHGDVSYADAYRQQVMYNRVKTGTVLAICGGVTCALHYGAGLSASASAGTVAATFGAWKIATLVFSKQITRLIGMLGNVAMGSR